MTSPHSSSLSPLATFTTALLLACGGCTGSSDRDVVVYCALDAEFAKPILAAFERRQDPPVAVAPVYDVESTKTVGLVNRIFQERGRPRCDVFWNNEVMHTIRLQKAGLLKAHDWDVPGNWPAGMKADDGTWCGFAARARVLLINTELLPDRDAWPRSVNELANEEWQGRCGIARPLFGTTATHAAVLDVTLGSTRAEQFLTEVASNAVVLSGNKQVAQSVSSGQLAWGLTDTDDAIIEKNHGLPVELVYPDQQPGQPGTLRIPNTLCILADAPHPDAAEKLVDFLLTPAIEERLAMGSSNQIPVHDDVDYQPEVLPAEPVRWMEADFEEAAERWEQLAPKLEKIFSQ